uniref:Uncharacterized protein n=1 Tax=Oryza rufipogon TaxID=4529 RepID=A0A0E0NQ61_ORYRU
MEGWVQSIGVCGVPLLLPTQGMENQRTSIRSCSPWSNGDDRPREGWVWCYERRTGGEMRLHEVLRVSWRRKTEKNCKIDVLHREELRPGEG